MSKTKPKTTGTTSLPASRSYLPISHSIPCAEEGFEQGLCSFREIPRWDCVDADLYRLDASMTEQTPEGVWVMVDLEAKYQRGHVWTDEQASAFLGYVLVGGETRPLIVQRYNSVRTGGTEYYHKQQVMVDGKQRYTAIMRWVKGEIPAVFARGTTRTHTVLWFRELSLVQRRRLPTVKVAYVDLTWEEQVDLYLRLNATGVAHTAEELTRVEALLLEKAA